MRRRWLLVALAVVAGAAAGAGACGDDDPAVPPPSSTASGGQTGTGGAGGEALGVPRFGDARVLVGGLYRPTRLALDDSYAYWTTQGGTAGGGAAATGGAGGAGGGGGAGTGAAAGAGGDGSIVILGSVVRVGKTGGTPTTLATAPMVTALRVDGPHVYFAVLEDDVGSIAVVSSEGGSAQTLLTSLGWPADVAVDDDTLYWSEVGAEGGVFAAPKPDFDLDGGVGGGGPPDAGGLDGGGREQLYTGSALVAFLSVDGRTLFFSDYGVVGHAGVLGAIDLQTNDVDLLVEELDRPRYFAFDEDDLYVVTEGDGRVQRIRKANGTTTILAYEQDQPYGVAVDEHAVYWTNSGTTPPAGDCRSANGSVLAMPRGGGEIVELASGQACPLAITVDDTGLYWINMGRDAEPSSGAIMRMPKR